MSLLEKVHCIRIILYIIIYKFFACSYVGSKQYILNIASYADMLWSKLCCGQNYSGTINKCLFPYNVKSVGGLCSFMTAKKSFNMNYSENSFSGTWHCKCKG